VYLHTNLYYFIKQYLILYSNSLAEPLVWTQKHYLLLDQRRNVERLNVEQPNVERPNVECYKSDPMSNDPMSNAAECRILQHWTPNLT
jgi:hypothetical protein